MPAGPHRVAVRLFDGPTYGDAFTDPEAIRTMATAAEAAGFDAIWATEHPIPPSPDAPVRAHDTFDLVALLGFVAAATSRLRLLTYALILPYRNPYLSAKAAASLDVLSGGRLILGVAAGYVEAEFRALGVDFDERNELTDEALSVMRETWTGQPFARVGRRFVADGNRALPRPVQRPGPPVWIGGNSKAAIRRAVHLGEGWMPFPNRAKHVALRRTPQLETADQLKSRIEYAQEYAAQVGRTQPLEIVFPLCFEETWKRVVPVEELLESMEELTNIGVTYFTMQIAATAPNEFAELAYIYGERLLATDQV